MAPLSTARRVNLIALYTLLAAVASLLAARVATHDLRGYHHLVGPFGVELSYDYGNILDHHTPTPLGLGLHIALWVALWTLLALTLRTHVSSLALGLCGGGALTSSTLAIVGHRVPNYIVLGSFATCNVSDLFLTVGIVLLTLSITAETRRRYRLHTSTHRQQELRVES